MDSEDRITSSDGRQHGLNFLQCGSGNGDDEDGSEHQHVSSYTLEKAGESTLIVRLARTRMRRLMKSP